MNVIVVKAGGVILTPILVEHETTAMAVYKSHVEEILGGDHFDEGDWMSDTIYSEVDKAMPYGYSVEWFTNITINTYDNQS